jgi:uncharacterized protein (TIGR03086 family)
VTPVSTPVPGTTGPPTTSALELLDRAVGYTRGSLALVREHHLGLPTPCAAWDLRALLRHMDDSLAAMAEAAQAPRLALAPSPGPADAEALLGSIRQRACTLVGQWMPAAGPVVALGDVHLHRELVGLVGALEITLHGWDVGQAVGHPRAIPPTLAMDLWPVARDHITAADRPARFGAEVDVPDSAPPQVRLLAHAGRRSPGSRSPGSRPPGSR